jgi:hypothetical protein
MIPDNKFPEIIRGLLEKTRQGKANWKEVPNARNTFRLQLSKSAILLTMESPTADPDYPSLQLLNEEGTRVGCWPPAEQDPNEDHPGMDILMELYEEVTKRVTKWDKVLGEIEAFLSRP